MLRSIVFSGLILMFLSACGGTAPDSEASKLALAEQVKEGEVLAQKYCGNCHEVPAPDLLNRTTWENSVLPRMGYMMGIFPPDAPDRRDNLIEPGYAGTLVENAGVFPKKAILSEDQWKSIKAYYLNKAPSEIKGAAVPDIEKGLKHFKVNVPDHYLSPPSTTLVKINNNKSFFIGDAQTKQLYVFDDQMELLGRANVQEGAVAIQEVPNAYLVTAMGSFSPTDNASGLLMALPRDPNLRPKVILDSLQRPVHTSFADFNGDGKEDILTCEFAKWTGKLTWWESREVGQPPIPHVLRQKPGAIKAYPVDLNNDKLYDIIALFGQGEEGIFIYYNQGGGKFREEKVLSFPSSYGSSYMQIYDFNQDGHWDILYTAGDNADYRPLMKSYHGIRIFTNDGNNQFKETFFYPLNGAYKAIPADFDQDGDMDFAAISFFPDYNNNPQEGFVYLENQGDMKFKPYTIPEVMDGRWITMDSGDVDQDGDIDIIIGSLAFEVIPKQGLVDKWKQNGIPFLYLENTIK